MRVLVVGTTGTLGRAVTAALRVRHEVLEASRSGGALVNAVSPGWLTETLQALGRSGGTPAAEVARCFVSFMEGDARGTSPALEGSCRAKRTGAC
jgi:hypothetical protein